jgi:hypothetical protein
LNTRYVVLVFVLLLASCGGGSSGDGSGTPNPPPPPPPGPTAEDTANARLAQTKVVFKAESSELTITWTDTFTGEIGYRVERQLAAGGEWQLQESLPSTSGTGTQYNWNRLIDQSATYRVVAQRSGYVVPLEAEQGATTVPVDLGARAMELLVDQADPLTGVVTLSVSEAASARSVEYFVDLQSIGMTSVGPSFPVEWNTATATDGNHLLIAHVDLGPGLRVELRRSVLVDNPNVAISLLIGTRISGIAVLSAVATSDAGIQSVEYFVNGASIGFASLAQVGTWNISLDTRSMPAGLITIRAVATDNAGQQAEGVNTVTVDNPPQVTLNSPVDGAIVSGSLNVQGTFVDDLPGTVVRILLRDVLILEASQSPFSTSFSLAGLPGGQYTLTMEVRDTSGIRALSQRAVIVSSSTFSPVRIGTFGSGTSLLDSDSEALLYRVPDGTVRVRQPDATEVALDGSAEIRPFQFVDPRADQVWQLDGNRVTTFGRFQFGPPAAFLFDSSGQREEVDFDQAVDTSLRSGLHGSWLVVGASSIYVRDLTSLTPEHGPIQGDLFRGHAFVTTPGQEALFFTRETGQQQGDVLVDVFRYSLADQSILQVSGGNSQHRRPKTDASRIAWEHTPLNQSSVELLVAPVGNPTASSVVSTQMTSFDLNDGVLAWVETASTAQVLRVDDGAGTTTVSTTPSTKLYSTANGQVIFSESGKLYVWSRAQGKRLLLDTLPAQVIQRDGIAFFTTGQFAVTIHHVVL